MKRLRLRRDKKQISLPEISLTPLIDTALTLLVIFMVTTPIMQNAIKVQLPRGDAKEDKGLTEDLTVYIDKERHFYVNGIPVKKNNLIAQLKSKTSPSQKTVYVKADGTVPYETVIDIVDHIKVMGGIEYVALATQKRA